MKSKIIISTITALSLSLIAQETKLNDVMVTATKQGDKKISAISGSVSVIDEFKLNDFNIDNSTSLQNMIPSFYITKTGPAAMETFASLRGIAGSMSGIPSVGFYVDDVYYSGLDMNLFDVERIEILKGPQGTLYGRNSEAGIINIVTKKPQQYDSGSIGIDYSSFNTLKTDISINKVINENMILRAAMRYSKTDGYFTNKYTNSDTISKNTNKDVRVSLYNKINDKADIVISYDKQKNDAPNHAEFTDFDLKHLRKNTNVDYLGSSKKDADGLNLKVNYDAKNMKVVSVTSFRNEKYDVANDIDFSPMDLMDLNFNKDVENISEELRFISNEKDGIEWIGGLFLLSEKDKREYHTRMNFANMGMGVPAETLHQKGKTETTGAALFGEMSSNFEDIKVTLGLRYDREKKNFTYFQQGTGGTGVLTSMGYPNQNGTKSDTFDAWLPKLSISYNQYHNFTPYFTLSRGFKSGGFNDSENMGSSFKPEFTTNYELGFKSSLLDNLQLNTAIFYIDWEDMQVEVPTASGTSVYTNNAAKASSKGIEIEIDYIPTDGLNITMGTSYIDATYDDYKEGASDYTNKNVVDSPKITLNFGANYRMENGFYIGANYSKFQDVYFDKENTKSQSYGITNAKLGYEEEDYDFYIYGNNIFDEEYITRAFEVNDTWYARAGDPQSFGVAVKYRF